MVIRDDVIGSDKRIQLDGVEVIGAGIGLHAVQDEVEVTRKFFNFWVVACFATVLDGERVKMKDVQQRLVISLGGLAHVDPNDCLFIFQ